MKNAKNHICWFYKNNERLKKYIYIFKIKIHKLEESIKSQHKRNIAKKCETNKNIFNTKKVKFGYNILRLNFRFFKNDLLIEVPNL